MAFVALILIAGTRLIPWVLGKIAETHSRELFTLGVLAIALGIAVSSAHFFGVSMALGAFLAGIVVGQSDFSARAGSEALPMRDAFAVMFFLSVGMLLEPQQILAHPLLTAATFAVVLVVKPLAAFTIVVLLGYGIRIGLGVAIALAQIGEFSFLVAVLGRDLGVLPVAMINPLVTTAIASIILNPVLYRSLPAIEKLFMKNRFSTPTNLPAVDPGTPVAHRAIVVGYGPVGQTVTRLLLRRGIEPTIIEMNIETFRNLQNAGVRVVYGDANQKEVLNQAGAGSAASVIFSSSGSGRMTEAFRRARQLNPAIQLVVRADYVAETPSLLKAGVNEVISDDGEVALALTGSILRKLGATPAQLDEERERTRNEMQNPLTADE
jgi:CPA2 family monovalent cation:H+ antiporter-2